VGGDGVAEGLVGARRHEQVEIVRRQLDAFAHLQLAREAAV
jgi:hypothetical protein